MLPRDDIPVEYVQKILDYDPITGFFTWKYREDDRGNFNARFPGKRAGFVEPSNGGYIRIVFNRRFYLAHRLAWAVHYGSIPPQSYIDHIDLNRTNNAISNLRICTPSENAANQCGHKDSVTGIKGVTIRKKTGTYVATITVNGKQIYLGDYPSIKEASDKYDEASLKYFGSFARFNLIGESK